MIPTCDRTERARYLLHRLVDQMVENDPLIDAEWERTFRRVRRDHFVPRFYKRSPDGAQRLVTDEDDDWLDLVYSNDSLFTSVDANTLSSSSMPGVMAAFLRLLDVRVGHDVLEIGTATGYNAALLCHRLGAEHVTTVDIESSYVEAASRRLETHYGWRPTVVSTDGALGYPPGAPYDRIIATCGVPRIPDAWIHQLKPAGQIVAPLQYHPRLYNGHLVTLRLQADGSLVGISDKLGAGFMPIRSDSQSIEEHARSAVLEYVMSAKGGSVRSIEYPEWFANGGAVVVLCKLQHPSLEYAVLEDRVSGRYPPVLANFANGSWAKVDVRADGSTTVTQGGPVRLWDLLEETRALWLRLGSPWLDRYGMTITSDRRQFVWLDSADSDHRWEL